MNEYLQPNPEPLGELEAQQQLNIQTIIRGAEIAAMYLEPGQNPRELDIDMVLEDLQAVVNGGY